MFDKLTTAILIICFIIVPSQVIAESKPQPLKPPELILFYENQQKITYTMDEKDKAVVELFREISDDKSSQPLFIYIHGRALGHIRNGYDEEPQESIDCCISELFSRYDASKILMFHWPHWGNSNDYKGPAQDAKSSGVALAELLAVINQAAGEKKINRPLILISHSMGSIVLEEALFKSPTLNLSNFNTVAIFSSASRYENSWEWLSKIKSINRYIFTNKHDPVLAPIRDALGECEAKCLNKKTRADDTVYIDVSPLELSHRYFVFGNIKGKENILADNIVQPILTGEMPKFHGKQPYADNKIFIIHSK